MKGEVELTPEQIRQLLIDTNVLLQGHFRLSSGKHSREYLQCAQVLQHPHHAATLGEQLAQRIVELVDEKPATVIGPALGGVIIGYEVARTLGVRSIFAERVDGEMKLRRSFDLGKGEKIIVVEDVVTTGGSLREVVELAKAMGANVLGCGAIVDRSGGNAEFSVPFASLISVDVVTYEPADCPLCRDNIVINKPGSR